jgi:hypothetical protein
MQTFLYVLKIENNVYTRWNKVILLELRVKIENKKKLFLNQIGYDTESFFTTLQPKTLEKKHHTAIKV